MIAGPSTPCCKLFGIWPKSIHQPSILGRAPAKVWIVQTVFRTEWAGLGAAALKRKLLCESRVTKSQIVILRLAYL